MNKLFLNIFKALYLLGGAFTDSSLGYGLTTWKILQVPLTVKTALSIGLGTSVA